MDNSGTRNVSSAMDEQMGEGALLRNVYSWFLVSKCGVLLISLVVLRIFDYILVNCLSQEIEEARGLLNENEYENLRENERNFKSSLKTQLMSLYNEIQSFEEASVNSNIGDPKQIEEELSAERLRLAESTQRLASLMFETDSIPSQQELAQYQQRFINYSTKVTHRKAVLTDEKNRYVTQYNQLKERSRILALLLINCNWLTNEY
ncbi:hypothetical protein KIN20_003333 [Parelaphostrongylus tenuis]|uniref:CCDC93 coiled-coil domain-containing protein n=1 Tax=Parelaphostrongylus tenuis TaxID=148309 RepID=A0AAD5QE94_PARTN|nr:hypothetical protein KIN20_003333 [Parelaphostrongylus tenuis]